MTCLLLRRSLRLGPGRSGMGITSLGRDAQGLTFSVVIPARVMQPKSSERGKQSWRIALCGYGMTFAPRHQVHLLCVASLAHLRRAHRLGRSLAGLCWRVRVGLAPGPSLNHKLRLPNSGGGWRRYLFPYPLNPSHRNAFQETSSASVLGAAVGAAASSVSMRWLHGLADGPQASEPSVAWVTGRWPVLTQIVQPASLQGRCTLPGGLRNQLPAG
jgi:hypothetical protein